MRTLRFLIFTIVLPFMVCAQLPEDVIYDAASGSYRITVRDENAQIISQQSFTPPTLVHPFVEAEIEFNNDLNAFAYIYTIQNGKNSQQNIVEFILEINDEPVRQDLPDRNWTLKRFFNMPLIGWAYTQTNENQKKIGVMPGKEQGDYILFSKTLPVIVPCYFSGHTNNASLPASVSQDIKDFIDQLTTFPRNKVKRWTIAPSRGFESIGLSDRLDSLSVITDQAYTLGWIKTVRIYNDISVHLQESRDLFKIESTNTALNRLEQLLRNLEQKVGKGLEKELYYLYRYHTESIKLKVK